MAGEEIGALVNSVARFIHLVACQTARNAPVVKYLSKAVAALKLLKPVLDGAIESSSYVAGYAGELAGLCEELDALVDEAREIVEKHAQRTSITCNVLQCEPLEIKIRTCSLEICRSLGESLQPDAPAPLHSGIQRCIRGLECDDRENTASRLMEFCLKDQRELGGISSHPENIKRIAESLGLTSTEQLFKERIALEKELARMEVQAARSRQDGDEAGVTEQLIELVRGMGGPCLEKQDGGWMAIPPYFRCPLSSQLMLDPVILASGQTFERSFIRRWLDSGLDICPVTRQALAHPNLVPNYTVKALIANWCEENSAGPGGPSPFRQVPRGVALRRPSEAGDQGEVCSLPAVSRREDDPNPTPRGHRRSESASSANSALVVAPRSMSEDRARAAAAAARAAAPSSSPWSQGTCGSSSYGEDEAGRTPSRSAGCGGWDEPADYALVESLLDDLRNGGHAASEDERARRAAAALELRLLAKNNRENRLLIARCGGIPPLVAMLRGLVDDDEAAEEEKVSRFYEETEENAVTALLNLSIDERNKMGVVEAGGVEPLVRVLRCGRSAAARENAAAALASLAAVEEHKTSIGRCAGAIRGLVDLLGGGPHGTARGKKDAATALFSLSILQENKARIVQAGAPRHLLEFLADGGGQEGGGGGMADKAAALLANLSTIEEGRAAIVQAGGIPLLVEVVETGSPKGKENAAAALLQLCMSSQARCALVLQEGAVPPLIGLSQLGTPRAREKAQQILSQFRCQRQEGGGMGRRRSS